MDRDLQADALDIGGPRRSAAFRIAIAAWAARRGASSTGSSPKAATIPNGPTLVDPAAEALGLLDQRPAAPRRSGRVASDEGTRVGPQERELAPFPGPRAPRRPRTWGGDASPHRADRGRCRSRVGGDPPRWSPELLSRYRSVLRGILSRAAARAMFQSVSRRASRRCSAFHRCRRCRGARACRAGPLLRTPRVSRAAPGRPRSRGASP